MLNDPIVLLCLSDLHFKEESNINDKRIEKIVDSLNVYKTIRIKNLIIVISGDLSFSGEEHQFKVVKKFVGLLIRKIKDRYKCQYEVLVVPGNHDVNYNNNPLPIDYLNNNKYDEVKFAEYEKMKAFYSFAKINNCFEKDEIYFSVKTMKINGINIKVNLINNAIFSTNNQYKGLLYIPNNDISDLSKKDDADFIITIMHHAPDFYRDDIKNRFEDNVVKNSNILLYGHEHYNYYKNTSYDNSNKTSIHSVGSLCNAEDWNNSSYTVGLLYPNTLKYGYHKFSWNEESGQYEHNQLNVEEFENNHLDLEVSEEFLDYIKEDYNEKYYVFPYVKYHGYKSSDDYIIDDYNNFQKTILNNNYSLITGSGNIGKTTLLKHLFVSFLRNHYYVVYGSAERLLKESNKKKQNTPKLIKSLFDDIYGANESKWQAFEQADKKKCIFIFDDYNQIDGVNLNNFLHSLSERFGTVILSDSKTINFDIKIIEKIESIAKYEIQAPLGSKRMDIIRAVVAEKASDKSDNNIEKIVKQINRVITIQLNLIPPEPYYIIQIAENFMNNVGEAIYKSTNAFSKVFEANLTTQIDNALKNRNSRNINITVDLMYELFGKIAYYIHFNKAYPIKRHNIDEVIENYNCEYGNTLVTEDIIQIAKASKILSDTEESSESFRFRNKSILAFFVGKEIISQYNETGDDTALNDVINKACINICTDILLFIIYLTDKIVILNNILDYIEETIRDDISWCEFSIPNNIPTFLNNKSVLTIDDKQIDKEVEKRQIEKSEKETEEAVITDFKIRDIYDWDDNQIDNVNGKLFRMTSLLQIVSKCLPCFEHRLKKVEKEKLIKCLYSLPNRIFMFWSKMIEENYNPIIEELKTYPYFKNKKFNMRPSEIDSKAKGLIAVFSINLLLNLYYIPVLNASGKNTFQFLFNPKFFDYNKEITYKLEHLMFLEQNQETSEFVVDAIKLKDDTNDVISEYLLQCIVQHGLVTRDDDLEDVNKLESKFYSQKKLSGTDMKKSRLIKRAKNKHLKK